MGKKKRQFIDKKSAQKFTLVHRSQRDPLQADEESSQHVLIPVDEGVTASASGNTNNVEEEEGFKYGVYFDDDYNYMQHLKPRGEGMLIYADTPTPGKHNNESIHNEKTSEKVPFGNILLPSEALPSKEEEDIGMLNKGVLPRGPQPDWDPEIVEALDDALDLDDPDNLLDDDFIMMANGDGDNAEHKLNQTEKDDEEWETDSQSSEGSYIDSDNLLSDEDLDGDEEETKSRFTSYSMTSSIIRRTQGLKLLDDRFEQIMEEYDEDEIGCVDHEEVTGNMNVNNELVSQIVDEFISGQKLHGLSEIKDDEDEFKNLENDSNESEEEGDEKLFAQFEKSPKGQWDCESIISTYSNIYNHPKLIIEEKKRQTFQLDKHTGIPVGVLKDTQKTQHDDTDNLDEEQITLNNLRNKNESLEEKRQRKNEVKEQRRNRRVEKKNNKLVFKQEHKKLEKVLKNTEVQKGIKL